MKTVRLSAVVTLAAWLGASAPAQSADPLGRLFFTPERRALLERQRQSNARPSPSLEGPTLSLDGIVLRSDGRRTLWINGSPQPEGENVDIQATVAPRAPGRARLVTAEEEMDLRVGESIHRESRQVQTGIEGGLIRVPARP